MIFLNSDKGENRDDEEEGCGPVDLRLSPLFFSKKAFLQSASVRVGGKEGGGSQARHVGNPCKYLSVETELGVLQSSKNYCQEAGERERNKTERGNKEWNKGTGEDGRKGKEKENVKERNGRSEKKGEK